MQVIIKKDGIKVSKEQERILEKRANAFAISESVSVGTMAWVRCYVFVRDGKPAAYVTADHIAPNGERCGEFIGNIIVSDIFEKSVDTVS